MSSQSVDVLFTRALAAVPGELSLALKAAGLDDPGLLDSYLRSSYGALVAAGVTGAVTAAGITTTGTGDTGTGDTGMSAGTFYGLIVLSYRPLLSSHLYHLSLHCVSSLVVCVVPPLLPSCLLLRAVMVSFFEQVRLRKKRGPKNTGESQRVVR